MGRIWRDRFGRIEKIDFVIPFPPLKHEGKVTKGVFFSQAVDVIVEKFPRIKEIFFPIANSMFSSYPDSVHADAFFVCYENPKREQHFKEKYPDKKNIVMLPLQDADFMNEYKPYYKGEVLSFTTKDEIDCLVGAVREIVEG